MEYVCYGKGNASSDYYKLDKNIIITKIEDDIIYFSMKTNALSFDKAADQVEKYVWGRGIINPIITEIKIIN